MPKIAEITGVILAGGGSTRFGSNKALAVHDGRSLISHAAAVIDRLFDHHLLIANVPDSYDFLGWPAAGDQFKGAGPLAGIHSALSVITTRHAFITGCDMPFLNEQLIRLLAESANEDWDVVVPCPGGWPEPLYGIYHRKCLPVIEASLLRDERKIGLIFKSLKVRRVEDEELLSVLPDFSTFLNVNRPTDLPRNKA